MRVYAVLFGVVVTAGSIYVAQLAVASAGFDRLAPAYASHSVAPAPAGELWYGGMLDPITIEASRTPPLFAFGESWAGAGLSGHKRDGECAAAGAKPVPAGSVM